MLMISLLFIIFTMGLHQVVKYAYHKINDWGNRKTKAITVRIPNFSIVLLHLFEGTNRNSDIIESF